MTTYIKKTFKSLAGLVCVVVLAIINYFWPLYILFEDTILFRLIWFAIFFLLLEIAMEIIERSIKNLKLAAELMNFSSNLKKVSEGFEVFSKVPLSNNMTADYVVVGSSGIWQITVREGPGKVEFNGEDIVHATRVLKGSITSSIEKSYSLAALLKKELNRDFLVASVIAFSNKWIVMDSITDKIRDVYISKGDNVRKLIEDTDVQILDPKTIKEISALIDKL